MVVRRRYRILINAVHARSGGGLTYLCNLLPLLAAEDDLDLHLVPHPSQAETFAALDPAIRIHRVAVPKSWFALLLWEQAVLPFLAWRIGYDAVLSPANFGPLLLRRQVIVLHNAVTVGTQENRLGKRLYWASLRAMTVLSLLVSSRAIAVSRYVAQTAGRQRRLDIVHHGVGAAISPAPPAPPHAAFLLAVGDLYIQKNLHALVDALAIVRRRHPALTLRIAGAAIDAAYAADLRRRIAAQGLDDAVSFLGRRDIAELVALYRDCAVFVFPSTIESFGMPLIEAMACGAPVVAANSSAVPEIAGDAALLCDPAAPADIAEKILRVLDDSVLRRDLSERSLARARLFSWTECARRTAAILRAAAGDHVVSGPS
jgi:glycosyltransferase involved in cell wall biosynthesis